MEEPLCCDCAPGKCPFIKIKDRTQPRKAHEDPLMSDLPSLLRPVAALSLCALAPLTTTHRQCLEKLGKGDRGIRCSLRPLAPPLCHIACTNGHAQAQRPNAQAPAAAAAAALWPTINLSICPSNPNTTRRRQWSGMRMRSRRRRRSKNKRVRCCIPVSVLLINILGESSGQPV